uniref:uncharacterized protein isoform X2 n=1 Tax=Myxine glutinosa TaxID=7769 RepID=UPI00358E9095
MDLLSDRGAVSNGKTLYWETHQVRALVSLWTNETVQLQLRNFRRNELVYCSLSDELAKIGIRKTAQQCREKLKRMKQEYRRIKNHNMQNDVEFKTSEYYDVFDAMLGHLPEGRGILQPGTIADTQSTEGDVWGSLAQDDLLSGGGHIHGLAVNELESFSTWLQDHGLRGETAQAVVRELGIECYESLRACAESASVRAELFSLARQKLPFTIYAEFRCFVESNWETRGSCSAGFVPVDVLHSMLLALGQELTNYAQKLVSLQSVPATHGEMSERLNSTNDTYGMEIVDGFSFPSQNESITPESGDTDSEVGQNISAIHNGAFTGVCVKQEPSDLPKRSDSAANYATGFVSDLQIKPEALITSDSNPEVECCHCFVPSPSQECMKSDEEEDSYAAVEESDTTGPPACEKDLGKRNSQAHATSTNEGILKSTENLEPFHTLVGETSDIHPPTGETYSTDTEHFQDHSLVSEVTRCFCKEPPPFDSSVYNENTYYSTFGAVVGNGESEKMDDGQQAKSVGPLSCCRCTKSFHYATALKLHLHKQHPGPCPQGQYCNNCGKESALFKKKKANSAFSCSLCGEVFLVLYQFQNHMRKHKDDLQECSVCGKMFAQSYSMDEHMKTHKRKRLYKCDVCKKTFAYSRSLDEHMRVHVEYHTALK